jgi:phosphoribosylaminoimidazole carboxylase (NCAIR synthetase)
MSFPSVGLIANGIYHSSIQEAAWLLGISVNYSSKRLSVDELVELDKRCDFIFVEPNFVPISTLKSVEKSGVRIYPPIKTIEQLDKITKYPASSERYSILIARSAHAQVSTWPISFLTESITITPAPSISEELATSIQLSAIKLAGEINLIGCFELIVDAKDHNRLIALNWLNPTVNFAIAIGSSTNYWEQFFRAILDLPLGSTLMREKFSVSGKLKTDPNSDDYRPYLHLMARNPNLKFNQISKEVAICGDEIEILLTEIIHAQQYYSGEIVE